MSFLVGVMLLVASVVAFWFALPQGGEVRSFLRNDQFQAYYADPWGLGYGPSLHRSWLGIPIQLVAG